MLWLLCKFSVSCSFSCSLAHDLGVVLTWGFSFSWHLVCPFLTCNVVYLFWPCIWCLHFLISDAISVLWPQVWCLNFLTWSGLSIFLDTFLHYLNSPFLNTRSGLAGFWRVVSPFYSLSDSSITLCDTCCDFVHQNRTEKTPSKSSHSSSEADLENIGSSTESVVSKTSLLWISMEHMGFRLYDYSLMPALVMTKKPCMVSLFMRETQWRRIGCTHFCIYWCAYMPIHCVCVCVCVCVM